MTTSVRAVSEQAAAEQSGIVELLDRWNDRSSPTTTATVPELFARTVRRTPDALALVDGTRRLTYRDLSVKVGQLAARLRRSGLPAEGVVAICMPRSAGMVIAVLASMVAGGAFVPVDPQWPAGRRERVVADSSARIALVAPDDESSLPVEKVVVSLDDWRFDRFDPRPPQLAIAGGQLAYVIFTSGSTGTPKGAMIRHEAICDRLLWQRDHVLGFGRDDASLFKAPLAFDISVNEILLPLTSGGCVVVAAPGRESDPEYLLDLIAAERVTYLYLVSSMLDALLTLDRERSAGAGSALAGVRHVWCGGEVLTPDLFSRFRQQLSTTLYHGYGPAEATIGVSHVIYRDRAERIATSIGRPNPHIQLYVLDGELAPLPIGVGGELYAAGFLLGRGYVGGPGLTAASFVANPFDATGSRMYRTGDLARWSADGSLEFLGRADNQVKIRGRRVELEEIEVSLSRHPRVRQAVVTVIRGASGVDRLVGYVTEIPGSVLDTDELARWCREQLPDYMVPTKLVVLERFPFTTNGKVDRGALPAPTESRPDVRDAPRTPGESLLCDIFARVLGVPEVGVGDDFFALGGDSIVAVTVVVALRSEGFTLRAKDIVAHRTPRRLATVLMNAERATEDAPGADRPLVDLDQPSKADVAAAVPDLREILPVTSVQSGIYFHSVAAVGADPYIVQQIVELSGPLDPDRLARATDAVIKRHAALAAGFHLTRSGMVISTVGSTPAPEFRSLRFVDDGGSGPDRFVARIAEQERERGFDLARPPLMRYTLVAVGEGRHRLIQTVHHIVADGWSVALIWNDILAAYRGAAVESDAPQYREFLRWWVCRRDPEREVSAWTHYLGQVDAPTLICDHLPLGAAGTGFGRRRRELDRDQRQALRAYARSRSVSEGAVMTVAWGVLVGCLIGGTDAVFGTTSAGRGEDVDGIDRIVGMVLNTVPTRVRWSHHDTIDEIVRRFVAAQTAVLDHQHVPLVDVHTAMGVCELFDTLFSIENLHRPDDAGELRLGPIEYLQAPHYRLTALVTLHDSVSVAVTNDRAAIDDPVTDRIADLFVAVVDLIVRGPDRAAGALLGITATSPADRALVATWSRAAAIAEPPISVAHQLVRRIADSADAVALVQGEAVWTYAQVGARVNRLARLLIESGVGPDGRVALLLPRSPELVVALLAVVAAGGVYVPVDPRQPAERIAHYLLDSTPTVVLTTGDLAASLTSDGVRFPDGTMLIDDPAIRARVAALSPSPVTDADRPAPLRGDHGAYVIYTSGSTGKPKGVLGSHAGLVNRLEWARRHWAGGDGTTDDLRLAKTAIGFIDGSTEILGALLAGHGLVVADESDSADPDRLAALIRANGVRQVTGVPMMLRAVAEAGAERVAGVRQWICSGETLASSVIDSIAAAAPDATVINSYGSSEVAGDVTYARLSGPVDGPIPIGGPVPGAVTYLLDAWLRPVPPGVVGELFVGGVQLARGYLGRPALTASRFVADPFDPAGGRLYRTGDLARWSADGQLHHLGRRDFQVQVNGIRVELEEVESAMANVPGVGGAAAVVHEFAGRSRLVGYVTAAGGGRLDERVVRDEVAAALPAQVVPTVLVLDALPLTPTGKVDRAALPIPDLGAAFNNAVATTTREPSGDAERIIAAAVAGVLGLAAVGVDDDFFDLGGDSVSSISLVRQARRQGLEFTIQDVFTLRTPARLAAGRVVEHPGAAVPGDPASPPPPAAPSVQVVPTVNHHRLRLAEMSLEDYVFTAVVDLPAPVGLARLRSVVGPVLRDVDCLRQRVTPRHRSLWTTEINPYTDDLAAQSASTHDRSDESAEQAVRAVRAQIVGRVDITVGRSLHVAGVTSAGGNHLVIAAHGLVADRRTVHQLAGTLAATIGGFASGAVTSEPPAVVASFADESATLAELAQSAEANAVLAHWADHLLALAASGDEAAGPFPASRTVRVTGPRRRLRRNVEEAFVAAVGHWSGTECAIDLEWDLRSHLGPTGTRAGTPAHTPADWVVTDVRPGPLTSVYPRLAGTDPNSSSTLAPWCDMLRYQHRNGRKKLRRVPAPGVLLTQLFGRPADPVRPEGFESLYRVVARFTITPDGVDLQILGPASSEVLLRRWVDELSALGIDP